MAKLKGAGLEDKKKVAIAGALGVVVLALAIHTLFGGPGTPTPAPMSAPPAAASLPQAPQENAQSSGTSQASPQSLDPTLHPEWMAATENYLYTGSGRNIFSMNSAPAMGAAGATGIERVKAPLRPPMQTAQAGPGGPPAINLRFFGYSRRSNGIRHAFLLEGDNIFVAAEGDIVGHRYKIVRIAPSSIEVEDLPYHDTQTLPLVTN